MKNNRNGGRVSRKNGPVAAFGRKIRLTALFSALLLLLCALSPAALAAAPLYELPADLSLHASSALLVSLGSDPSGDLLLGGKNMEVSRSPSALVRLMVGAYAATLIEEKKLDLDKATGTYTADCFALISGSGVATAQMELGETWTLRDLLTMSMMQTAGDAVVTLAITLGGQYGTFIDGMNRLAEQLGCQNTHFVNVTGLDAPGQYTTAYDLYLIFRHAMSFPELRTMMGTVEYTVKPVSGGKERLWVTGNNLLRTTTAGYYAPAKYGRTGYTDQAGRCLAAVAASGGYESLCIVLGCPETDESGRGGISFADAKTLFKWGFQSFSYKVVLAKGEILYKLPVKYSFDGDSVSLISQKDVSLVVPADLEANTIKRVITLINGSDGNPIKTVEAPVKKGTVLGKVELFINLDTKIGEADLVAGESLGRSGLLSLGNTLLRVITSPWFFAGLGALLVCIALYVWALIARNRSRRGRGRKLTFEKRR